MENLIYVDKRPLSALKYLIVIIALIHAINYSSNPRSANSLDKISILIFTFKYLESITAINSNLMQHALLSYKTKRDCRSNYISFGRVRIQDDGIRISNAIAHL